MSDPNPLPFQIPSDSGYTFSAMSNASYLQRVTISIQTQVVAVFTGSGEGVPMTTDGSPTYGGSTRQQVQGTALFEYSQDGGVTYNKATVTVTPTSTGFTAGTEDGGDGDNNDTVLTFVAQPL